MALPLFSVAVAGRVCIRPGERVGVSSSRGDFTGPLAGATRLICVSCFCHYRFALASHFFWGLWSIVQAKISSIEFGYMVRLGGSFSLLPPGENATVHVNAWRQMTVPYRGSLVPRKYLSQATWHQDSGLSPGGRGRKARSFSQPQWRSALPSERSPPGPAGPAPAPGERCAVRSAVLALWPLQGSGHLGPRGPSPDLGALECLVHL